MVCKQSPATMGARGGRPLANQASEQARFASTEHRPERLLVAVRLLTPLRAVLAPGRSGWPNITSCCASRRSSARRPPTPANPGATSCAPLHDLATSTKTLPCLHLSQPQSLEHVLGLCNFCLPCTCIVQRRQASATCLLCLRSCMAYVFVDEPVAFTCLLTCLLTGQRIEPLMASWQACSYARPAFMHKLAILPVCIVCTHNAQEGSPQPHGMALAGLVNRGCCCWPSRACRQGGGQRAACSP